MKSDAMAENFNSDEIGVVPCKKRKTDSSVDTARENAEPELTSASKNNLFLNRPDPGRHLRYHSVEQDDIQSSSGNSSNMENGNLTEDDSGNISDTSSHASSSDWQPRPTGVLSWVHTQMMSGVDPREILGHLLSHFELPPEVSDLSLWKLIVNILSEPERRTKLENVNTLEDVVNLIKNAKKILVLTGAGVSVSCGIPDFRSRDGVYSRLAVDFPDLPDPQAIFDITYFMQDPRPFFKFAKEIYPGQFEPSRGHRFISLLQKTGRLLRNYSQNIDTLEQVAGISNVIQCHGSFATATCLRCNFQTDCEAVREDIFNQTVPRCPKCPPGDELSIMKPDIVFFGENLPEEFHRQMTKDKDQADLLIVIGSSLKVRPVALIPNSLPNHIPQVLINREPLPHVEFDVELLGDGDLVVSELCKRLEEEFSVLGNDKESLTQITYLPSDSSSVTEQKGSASGDASNLVEDTSVTEEKNEPSQPATELVQGDDNNNTCGWSLNKSDHDGLNHTDDVTATGTMETTNAKEVTASSDTEPADRNDTIKLMRGTCGISDTHTNNPTHVTDTTDADIDVQSSLTDSNQEKAVPVNHEAKNSVNVCMDSTISKEPCGEEEDSGEKDKERGESGNDDMPPSSNSDSENEFLRSLWKSKWKQSISKRLPAGTFYYDGGHRYIFPGAEVAPEEDDDVSDSDFDTPGAGEDDGKSSSDESEEDIKGPGGLSSTRRNLKTSLSHANSCIPFNLPKFHQPDRQCCTMKHEGHSAHCSERDGTSKKEKPDDTSHKSPARSSEVPSNLKNEAKGLNASGSIIPDELHELIEMETLPMDSKRENVPGGQLHSPMSPSLHQILHYNPMRAEDTRILDKVEHDVLDTDQILEIPSSSLLPSLDGLLPVLHDTRNTRDTSPRMTEQNSDSKSQESET